MSSASSSNRHSRTNAAATTTNRLTINLHHLLLPFMLLATQCHQLATPESRRTGIRDLVAAAAPTTTTPSPQPVELPEFEEPIGNHTVAMGRDAQLSCKISNLGNFRTAWLRVEDKGILTIHNNVITRNYRVSLNQDGKNFVLTIKNVMPSDKGGYMCQINSVPMKFAIGHLDVLTPPAFEETAGEGSAVGQVTVAEGGSANLTCQATGHPQPVITWRREDNEPIQVNGALDDGQSKVESSSLGLSSVSRLQSGAYLCIASNGVQPSASRRQLLDVQFKPVIRLPQTEVGAQLNQQSVKLNCYVELNPAGSYQWIKLSGRSQSPIPGTIEDDQSLLDRGDELTNSDKYEIVIKQQQPTLSGERVQMVLNIRHVEKQDFAWYKCMASNSLGVQSSSVRLYESSSFSLDSMFRGSGASSPGELAERQLQLSDSPGSERPPAAGRPMLSTRTHTRSSWTQRAGGSIPPRLHDSATELGSSAASPAAFTSSCLFILLLASIAQIFVLVVTNPQIHPDSHHLGLERS